MTAQASDMLVMDGECFMVRDYISQPLGVESPPMDPYVSYSNCWNGYTSRWEVNEVDGEKRLFLIGFYSCGSEIDGYFPLYESVMNPISERIKVVLEDAECISFVHMGFEGKYTGEKYLVFQWGKLVGIEEIPDDTPNQNGLLDMAGLHPKGKKKGREEIEQMFSSYTEKEGESTEMFEHVCSACGEYTATTKEWDPNKVLCHSCGLELVEIGKAFKNWRCDDEPQPYKAFLYDTVGDVRSPKVNPEWHRKSRLLGVAFLKYSDGKKQVVLEFSGYKIFRMKEKPEISGQTDPPLEQIIAEHISAEITDYEDIEIDARVSDYVAEIYVKKEFKVETPAMLQDEKLDPTEIADNLEEKLDKVVEAWVAELFVLLPILRKVWKQVLDDLTGGTGIYPYDPSERTPLDDEIVSDVVYLKMRLDETRKWVIQPRHSKDGWLPGIRVIDVYLESLNL